MKRYLLLWMVWFLVAAAAPQGQPGQGSADDNEIDPKAYIKDEVTEPKEFLPHERKATCRKYEGKYIAYAANVYLVEKCKAREVQNSELIFALNRDRKPIISVEAAELARLETGDPIVSSTPQLNKKPRKCEDFNKKYVTYLYAEVYFVEKCERRLFLDWESYIAHRKKNKVKADAPIEALTWDEFGALKHGEDMPTILEKEFAEALDRKQPVEVIPIDEACKGLEGKYVTFHSKMYFVEKCRKREIDPQDFTLRFRNRMPKFVEMQPQQWYSMPEGKPYRPK